MAGHSRRAGHWPASLHLVHPVLLLYNNTPCSTRCPCLQVYDRLFSVFGSDSVRELGGAQLPLACIPGTDPIYAWLPLKRTKQVGRTHRLL